MIEVLVGTAWHRYLTNELDPARLPPAYAVALYSQSWRIVAGINEGKGIFASRHPPTRSQAQIAFYQELVAHPAEV